MSGAPKDAEWYPRTVYFSSGAALEFHMPENFSKDMPAEDLVEQVNLNQLEASDPAGKVLMRRWWDFRSDGFFSKNLGSVMMSIRVNSAQKALPSPLDFAVELRERLLQINADHLKEISYNEHPEFALVLPYIDSIRPVDVNDRTWLRYSVSQGKRFELNLSHQLDASHYITLSFEALPADNVELVPFMSTYVDPHMNPILDSVRLVLPGWAADASAYRAIEGVPQREADALDKALDQKYLSQPEP